MATPRKRLTHEAEAFITDLFVRASAGEVILMAFPSKSRAYNARQRFYAFRAWLKVHRRPTYRATSQVKLELLPSFESGYYVRIALCLSSSSTSRPASNIASPT